MALSASTTGATGGSTAEPQGSRYVLSLPLDRHVVEDLRERATASERSLAGHVRFLINEHLRAV
jgi:hypothetical protein